MRPPRTPRTAAGREEQDGAADAVDAPDEVMGRVVRAEAVGRAADAPRHPARQHREGDADSEQDEDREPGRGHHTLRPAPSRRMAFAVTSTVAPVSARI